MSGIRDLVSDSTQVFFDPVGQFDGTVSQIAEVGIVVLAETPYAEGFGDREDLTLSAQDIQLIQRMRSQVSRLVVVLLSGRQLILTEQLPMMDALVAAWLPGSEGQGVADVLFGDLPFTGQLPYSWPRSIEQVPLADGDIPLFPFGFGLQV